MNRHAANEAEEKATGRFSFPGLWRDGKSLVIDLAEHHLPRRCLKSNEVVELPFEPTTLTLYSPGYSELKLLQDDPRRFARTKYEVISGHKQQTRIRFELPLPLSPRWRAILLSKLGAWALWIGAAMLLGTYFGWVILHSTFDWRWIPQLSLTVALLLLAAGAAFQFFVRWTLRVHKLFDGKIWVAGVHPQWLRRLPEFIPSKRMLTEEIQILGWSFWICTGGGLLLLILFLAARLRGSTAVEEAGYRSALFTFLTAAAAALLVGNRARTQLLAEKQQLQKHYPVLDRKTYQRIRSRQEKRHKKRSR